MRQANSSNSPWSDEELADAIDAYVFLLRAQAAGLNFRREAAAGALLDEGLPQRNEASLRYRFRNISAVVEELGLASLAGYSPAEQVGTRVRERIKALLQANVHFLQLVASRNVTAVGAAAISPASRDDALAALEHLRRQIDEVEREVLGIGHNNPPEPLAYGGDRREAFSDAKDAIVSLQAELAQTSSDTEKITHHSERLLQFGVKLTGWLGQRTTKFADGALAALAPALVVKVTGLLPAIVDALSAIGRALGH